MTAGRRSWLILLLLVVASVLVAGLAPRDQVLGASLRIVYLHGAWVWAALLLFAGAALAGILGFALKRDRLHYWSVGLARSATVFWLTSLLLSLAAMQTSWNGLYLAELAGSSACDSRHGRAAANRRNRPAPAGWAAG
jgi:hypothetical protein